jgi:N-acetylmuramoyl-L-alanine amidase
MKVFAGKARMARFLIMAAVWLATLGAPGMVLAASGSGARLGIHGDGVTRFVLDLSDNISFKTAVQADPYRVIIESAGLDLSGLNRLAKPWGSVNGVHAEGERIVLDLRKPALVKSAFIIAPRDGLGYRLVVDLADATRDAFLAQAEPAAKKSAQVAKAAPAPKPAPPPVPVPVVPMPVVEVPAPAPPPPVAPVIQPPPARIVVTSPNAQPQPQAAADPLPEPVTSAVIGPAERGPKGQPMISAPLPPPPERPQPVAQPQPPAPAPAPQPVAVAPPPKPEPPAKSEKAETASSQPRARDGVPVIVIDPGHGGVDPGATGVSGIYEKHITLAMARELKAALEKNGRYRVHLTRDRDIFIRLRDRVAIARQYGADLFISLHADAVQSPAIRGLSVYTLSQNASDSEAQALAEKENKADLIAGVDLSHESPDVAGILIDLAQRETMNRSAGFATDVVDEVGQELDLLDNTHRFAGFAVLKAPDVPAVLVEMGYLSNEFEEKQLRQPQYRARLAKAMAKAVERFFPSSLKAKRP